MAAREEPSGRMDEQSHKDEMRAAVRGDFERLRARLGGPGPGAAGETALPCLAPTAPTAAAEPVASGDGQRGLVARLLGRT